MAHTLKGSAASVGLLDFSGFEHCFESMLDLMRKSDSFNLGNLIQSMHSYQDLLEAYVEGLKLDRSFELDLRDLESLKDRSLVLDSLKAKGPVPAEQFRQESLPSA